MMNKQTKTMEKKTFEDFLMKKHAEEHIGTKETLIDSFDDWLSDLEIDDIIDYADIVLNKQKRDMIKIVEKMRDKLEDRMMDREAVEAINNMFKELKK